MKFIKTILATGVMVALAGSSLSASANTDRDTSKQQIKGPNTTSAIAPVEPMPDALREISHQQFNQSLQKFNQNPQTSNSMTSKALATCTASEYANRSGQSLVDYILTQDMYCINDLFEANSTSFAAFTSAKMVTVANAAASLAQSYRLGDSSTINNLYYFLRTGYYHEYYSPDRVGPFGSDVKNAIRGALDSLVNNADFYGNSEEHGKAIYDAIILIDSAGENTRYLPMIKEWLSRWNSGYANSFSMRSAVNNIFTVLFRGHYNNDFIAATASDTTLIRSLGSFARQDWMLGTESQFMQENAGGELARFLQYTNASVYSTVQSEVSSVLNRYSLNGKGRSVWLRVATVVDYLDKCSEYNICGFKEQLEAQVLPLTHTCSSSLVMRAEDITTAQFNESCNLLTVQESYFHQKLQTNNTPVANDYNTNLEMVVFDNSSSYQTNAGVLFDIDTNNGGMYLEGDPSVQGNQARFIAYEAEWMLPEFHIWNLTHEYVHYLDGRFNLKGDFADSKTGTHKTVWWIEGLAEYISKKDLNDTAIELARTKAYSLSSVFNNTYNSGQDLVYRWGYLAVRFMFEKHPSDVQRVLSYFRAGDYDGYLSYIKGISTSYDSEWNTWLGTVQSTDTTDPTTEGELTNGVPVTIATPTGSGDLEFFIKVPAGATNLSFTTSGGSGDADIMMAYNRVPTPTDNDCRPYKSGNNETCSVAQPQAGKYFLVVENYSDYAGVSLVAQFTPGDDTPKSGQLTKGQTVTVASPADGSNLEFYIDVPANATDLTFDISGGSGDADIMVAYNRVPTQSDYDCRPYLTGNNEQCQVAQPQSGRWYVVVERYSDYANVALVADYVTGTSNACDGTTSVNGGQLQSDTPVCVAGSSNPSYFSTYINAGTSSLTIQTSGGTGNVDVYARSGSWPSTSTYDAASTQSGNTESITISNPPSGWFYISLVGSPDFANTSLNVVHQ
ncbi:M9 family metallopeptidase [Aliikangiella maris]|uniref:M9 family metallopeptidase n=2 Tax=Aliikangiella maris TaxID=3162458 RepID=A0ABV3MS78_9GAMM